MLRALIGKLRRPPVVPDKLSYFQRVFLASKVNGAEYRDPPPQPFALPKGTWLQRRRERR